MTYQKTTDARMIRSFQAEMDCGPEVSYVVAVEAGAIAKCLFMLCSESANPGVAEVRYWIPSGMETNLAIRDFAEWVWRETSLNLLVLPGGVAMRRPDGQ